MNYKHIQKPKTTKAQIDLLWDFVFNYLYHAVSLNTKLLWILLGALIALFLIEKVFG